MLVSARLFAKMITLKIVSVSIPFLFILANSAASGYKFKHCDDDESKFPSNTKKLIAPINYNQNNGINPEDLDRIPRQYGYYGPPPNHFWNSGHGPQQPFGNQFGHGGHRRHHGFQGPPGFGHGGPPGFGHGSGPGFGFGGPPGFRGKPHGRYPHRPGHGNWHGSDSSEEDSSEYDSGSNENFKPTNPPKPIPTHKPFTTKPTVPTTTEYVPDIDIRIGGD